MKEEHLCPPTSTVAMSFLFLLEKKPFFLHSSKDNQAGVGGKDFFLPTSYSLRTADGPEVKKRRTPDGVSF